MFFLLLILKGQAQQGSIVLPKFGQHLYADSTLFSWNVVDIASYYHLQIATDSSFNTLVCDVDVYTEDTIIKGFTHPNTYYWRVKSDKTAYTYIHKFHYYLPTDFNQLIGWYSADSVHMVNGYVDTLYDKSDKLHHVVQTSTNSRPLWIAQDSTLNNNPSIYFDGNDKLTTYGNPALYAQPNTFFVLAKLSTSTAGCIFSGKTNTNRQQLNVNPIEIYAGTTLTNKTWKSNYLYNLYNVNYNLSQSFLICLNDTILQGNVGNFSMQMLSLGGAPSWGLINVYIPEFIAYNKTLSSIENYHINNYIGDKYCPMVDLGKDIYITYGQDSVLSKDLSAYLSCLWSTGDTSKQIKMTKGVYWVKVQDKFGRESVDTIEIKYNNLTPLLKNSPYLHCQFNTLQISFQDLCRKESWPYCSNFSYQWSNGQTGANFSTTEAGVFSFVVTNMRGYSDTAFFEVKIDSLPTKVRIRRDNLCVGSFLELVYPTDVDSVPYQIVWNRVDTMSKIVFKGTAQYEVEVLDSFGCVGRDVQTITTKGYTPVVSFSTNNICRNQQAEFVNQSYATDGSRIIESVWDFGDGHSSSSLQPKALESRTYKYDSNGIYQVKLLCKTSSGCEYYYTQTIAVYELPRVYFLPNQACEKTDFVFTNKTQSDYPIKSYFWRINGTDTTSAINPQYRFESVGTTNVELVAESVLGCKDTLRKQFEIKSNPKPTIVHNALCIGQDVNFVNKTSSNVPILAYKWYINGNQETTNDKLIYQFAQEGQYQLQLQVQYVNGCMNTQTEILSLYPRPIADFTAEPICQHQHLSVDNRARVFTPNPKPHYHWAIDGLFSYDSIPVIEVPHRGYFPLTQIVTDEQGCSDTAEQVVRIAMAPHADFTYEYTTENPYEMDFKHMENIENTVYTWIFNDKDTSHEEYPSYDFEKEGDYPVQLVAKHAYISCQDTAKKMIQIEKLLIDLEFVNFFLQEEKSGVRPIVWVLNKSNRNIPYLDYKFIYGQEWVQERDTNTLQIGLMNKYAFASASRNRPDASRICVEVSSPYDNYKSSSVPVTYCITQADNLQMLDIYPNPANDKIVVHFVLPEAETLDIKLCDMMGNVVYRHSQSYEEGYYQQTVHIGDLSAGVYVVQMCAKNRIVSKKVIKL